MKTIQTSLSAKNTGKHSGRIFIFLLLVFTVFSCNDKKNRFSNVNLNDSIVLPVDGDSSAPILPAQIQPIKIQRFDKDFFNIDLQDIPASLTALRKKYGRFADLYFKRILLENNPMANEEEVVREFLTHPAYREFYADCEKKYVDMSDLEAEFTTAFKYVKYYFPSIVLPNVYTHVSGFGDMIVVDEGLISISLDYYLGADYKHYAYVDGIYDYTIQNLRREKIVPDAIFWWLTTEFTDNIDAPRLLDNMIYYGKIMYLTEVFLPDETEENLMGYTKQQWKWCKANEAQMWNYITGKKHLFSSEALLTSKYINPAPFTSFFPEESPGRTGMWIGWQIVRSYMDKNRNITLPELMNNFDAQGILEKSGYRP